MSFLHRYENDTSRPTVREAARDLSRRTLAPGAALFAVIVGAGFAITGPLHDIPAEESISEAVQADRTPELNTVTQIWSRMGNTESVIAICVVISLLVLWRTRQWWLAVIPGIAVAVQATVFVVAAAIVGRGRPDVEHLDPAPPTSSYPSGHAGASTAFYLTLALLAQRIRRPVLRWGATVVCFLLPMMVAFARLYRGMHHLSDILIGLANGVVCAWLAWRYLRRDESGDATTTADGPVAVRSSDPTEAGPREGVEPVGREA